ncbi:unnamed protein product [Closterium sp. NIES-53]
MDDPEALLPSIERRTKQLRQQEQMLREAVTAASRRKETSAAALRSAEDAHQQLLRDRFPALNAQVTVAPMRIRVSSCSRVSRCNWRLAYSSPLAAVFLDFLRRQVNAQLDAMAAHAAAIVAFLSPARESPLLARACRSRPLGQPDSRNHPVVPALDLLPWASVCSLCFGSAALLLPSPCTPSIAHNRPGVASNGGGGGAAAGGAGGGGAAARGVEATPVR